MKLEGQKRWLPLAIIAVVGISGIIEAWPQASESMTDLLIDAAILAGIVAVSILLARLLGKRGVKSS